MKKDGMLNMANHYRINKMTRKLRFQCGCRSLGKSRDAMGPMPTLPNRPPNAASSFGWPIGLIKAGFIGVWSPGLKARIRIKRGSWSWF